MVDVVSSEKRSEMMSGIRGKDTRPELLVRKALHARGFRYRLHDKMLPGKPDMSFPRYRAVVQIYGCFWHGHDCSLFKWPETRREFWRDKINGNSERDREKTSLLTGMGWRTLVLWECALKGRERLPFEKVIGEISGWLLTGSGNLEIRGEKTVK